MIITWKGKENFNIKTKKGNVQIGEKNQLLNLDIENPGEYEVGGVQMEFIDGVIQVFSESITIGHIKKGKVFTDAELEKLNGIDVLLIGVGGSEFTETQTALQIISQIEPNIVIPMYEGKIDDFIKEEGISSSGKDELKIIKNEMPQEERQVVILNPSN